MSTQASAVPTSPSSKIRPSVNFHPNLWGNYFLTCASETIDTATQEQHETLKEEVRRMIISSGADSLVAQKVLLQLIDTIQRLDVAYHFKKEIEDALFKMIEREIDDNDDLYSVSLRFRLFRQQGIMISCDVFNKFKDDEGKYFFKDSLIKNVEGMLSLYEATYLSFRGEEILDEAFASTTTQLKSMVGDQIYPNLAKKINHALYNPLHKAVPRFEARDFFDMYARDDFHNQTLLQFAKLDFNIVQAQRQKELSALTRWWRDLDFITKVPYAKDRLVELYFWTMETFVKPKYTFGRITLTKLNCMISVIDDTFDAYGIFEELQLFTEAIRRWDISVIDILPEYMKIIYKTLLDTYNDIEEELAKEERSHCIQYAKEKMQELIEMNFAEAKWLNEGCIIPTMEEYMSVALTTVGFVSNVTICFLGMGDLATEDTFKWIFTNPKILTAASVISRFMNDIAGHEFEQKRGHVASAVECCMKQYSVSEEAAVKMLKQEVANAWKDMNEELFLMKNNNNLRAVPFPLLESILNLVRACDYIYKDGERYVNNYLMKDKIASVLKDPVIL